jgi:hypothetical protein
MTLEELRRLRGAAQLLHRPGVAGAAGVVGALLAVQAQDRGAARLALRARSANLAAQDVDRALHEDRTLVVTWLARGTLHMVRTEDHAWLLGLTAAGRSAGGARRLAQEGVSPDEAERAVEIIERSLADEGPLTRAELAERIGAHGIRAEGQAAPHLLALAARRGLVVLGPMRGAKQAYALTRDWLGAPPPGLLTGAARDTALAELARRYLHAHGPATGADLAAWAGLPLRDARTGLAAIARELSEAGGDLVDLTAREPVEAGVGARLLAPFDPYLLGWKERAFAVPAEHARAVHPGGGLLRAVATDDGAVVGTWRARRRDGRIAIELEPFGALGAGVAAGLRAEAADVARFEGLEVG